MIRFLTAALSSTGTRSRSPLVAAALLAMSGAASAQTLTWTGATNGAWDTTTANWAGTASLFANGATVTFDDTATGTTGITTAAAVSPAGTVTFNNATKNYSLSGAGGLSGTLNLTKLGAGALTLSNSNAFTGTTTLQGGTTTLSGNAILTATSAQLRIAPLLGDNATLVIRDNASYFLSGINAGAVVGSTGTVLIQGGTLSNSGGGQFRIGDSGTGTLTQTGGLVTFSNIGALPSIGRSTNGVGQMTVSGGTFQLTGSNSVLQIGAAGAGTLTVFGNGLVDTGTSSGNTLRIVAQSGTAIGVVNLDGGTIRARQVDMVGGAGASSTFNFNGGTLVALTSNGNFMQTLTNAFVKAGGAVINTNGNGITIAQSLRDGGGGGLTKQGAGTLTLSGSNTYTGTTTISSGALSANNANALGAGGSITLAGGTLQYTAASAGQDWGSRFKNSTSAIALDTNGQNVSLAGAIDNTNTGGLTKLSSGTLTLTGNNTYTGATTVNGGSLLLAANGSLTSNLIVGDPAGSAGTVLITGGTVTSSGGLFRIGSDGNGTLNQSGGLVTIANSGALPTIGRFSTSTSAMTISSGTFRLTGSNSVLQVGAGGNAGAGGLGTLTVSGNGLVDTGTSSGNALRIVAQNSQGTGVVNLDGGTIRARQVDTTGTGAASSTFNFNGGTLVALMSNGNYLQGLTAANVRSGGAVIDTNGNAIAIAQNLLDGSGGGGLTKQGAGSLTLSGTNTYTGNTTISVGTLAITSTSALPGWNTAGRFSVANGAVLAVGDSVSAAAATTLLGTGNFSAGSMFGIDTTAGRTLSSPLSGSFGLAKAGAGTLTLSASNAYTGATLISGGVVVAGDANALGAGGSITLAGGTLQYTAASAGQDWGSRFKNSTSAIALDTNGQNVALAGAIDTSNIGGLTKLNSGTLTLTGNNTYSGTTTVNGGALVLAGNGSLTSNLIVGDPAGSTGTVMITGGTVAVSSGLFRIGASGSGTLNQSGGLVTFGNSGALPTIGRFAGSAGQMTVSSGTFQLTGSNSAIQVGADLGSNGTLTVSGNGLIDTGTSSGNVLRIVALNGQGTGVVNLDGGILRARQVDTTGTGAASSTFNFNGGTLVALTSNTTYLQGLTAANVRSGGAIIDTNGNAITIAQNLLNGGGGGGLTKQGAGTLALSGSNTYTGSTLVNAGTLAVNGSLAGGVAVAAGAELGGSGSVGAISGAGLVGPGNSPGILTATSINPTGGMAFAFELTAAAPTYGSPTGTPNDLLSLTGGAPFASALSSANTVSLYFSPAALATGTITGGFFTANQADFLASIQSGAFAAFVQDPAGSYVYGGQTYKTLLEYDASKSVAISTVAANGGQVMQMVVVPEPGAVVLAGVGVAAAAWMARRRTVRKGVGSASATAQ